MKHWGLAVRIWFIVGLSVVTGAASSGFLYYRLQTIVSAYERLFDRDVREQDRARVMQVTFKKSIQEWKDTLLRGGDPPLAQEVLGCIHRPNGRCAEGRRISAPLRR